MTNGDPSAVEGMMKPFGGMKVDHLGSTVIFGVGVVPIE